MLTLSLTGPDLCYVIGVYGVADETSNNQLVLRNFESGAKTPDTEAISSILGPSEHIHLNNYQILTLEVGIPGYARRYKLRRKGGELQIGVGSEWSPAHDIDLWTVLSDDIKTTLFMSTENRLAC